MLNKNKRWGITYFNYKVKNNYILYIFLRSVFTNCGTDNSVFYKCSLIHFQLFISYYTYSTKILAFSHTRSSTNYFCTFMFCNIFIFFYKCWFILVFQVYVYINKINFYLFIAVVELSYLLLTLLS